MTNEFRKGNLNAAIEIKSTDEIGILGENFHYMAEQIRLLSSRLENEIKESKSAAEKLRFQNEIMTNMTEAVYLVRLEDNIIVYTNSNYEKLFGYANVSVFDHSKFGKVFVSFHTDITERKQAEKLQDAVYRITKATDVSPTIDDLFKNLHGIIKEVMTADNFYIALYDEQENLISTPYYMDEVDPLVSPKKPGKGLTEYVIFNSTSLLCDEKLFDEMLSLVKLKLLAVRRQYGLECRL